MQRLYRLSQVAKILGLSYGTIYRYCFKCCNCEKSVKQCNCNKKETILHPLNIGLKRSQWRVSEKEIKNFLKKRRY